MSHEHILNKMNFDTPDSECKLRPVQVGRIICHPGHIIARHTHIDWFELTVVTDGEGIIETNGERLDVTKGDIYLSFPCEVHSIITSEKHQLKYDFLAFVPIDASINESFEDIVRRCSHFTQRRFRESRVASLVDCCINTFLCDDEDKNEYFELALMLVSKEIIRKFADRQNKTSYEISNQKAVCIRVTNYIDTHIYSLKSLSQLSDITGYNYSYLSSVFKSVMGQSLSQYYAKVRFERAKILITEGERSVSEIALLLGYSSVYAFSKAFRDETGLSPKKYYAEHFSLSSLY